VGLVLAEVLQNYVIFVTITHNIIIVVECRTCLLDLLFDMLPGVIIGPNYKFDIKLKK
jgi:hypothetical protein